MTTIRSFPLSPIHAARLSALALACTLAACATTIPETDTEAPEVRLTISGPGLGRQEMSNPPRAAWTGPGGVQLFDLQPNVRYNFILSVGDEGGAARAHLRMPDDVVVTDLAPTDVEETTSGVSRSLTLFGDRSSPTTGLVISGTLTAPRNTSFEFQAEGDDFGGVAGRTNQRFLSVNVFVGDG
jgi:hypothetical protein